jgi:hypothetical protein
LERQPKEIPKKPAGTRRQRKAAKGHRVAGRHAKALELA